MVTREQLIREGLIQPGEFVPESVITCGRKVRYVTLPVAFEEALRLANRRIVPDKRVMVYVCKFCSGYHIGNRPIAKVHVKITPKVQSMMANNHNEVRGLKNELAEKNKELETLRAALSRKRARLRELETDWCLWCVFKKFFSNRRKRTEEAA